MSKREKALIILLTPFVLGLLIGILIGRGCSGVEHAPREKKVRTEQTGKQEMLQEEAGEPEVVQEDDVDGLGEVEAREVIYYTRRMAYAKVFDDVNETHLDKAKLVGLKKIPEKRDAINTSQLVQITDSDFLVLDNLRYSVPYLTSSAARELNHIARAFHDSLTSKKFPLYKLVVSSVLRTEEDVTRLRKSGNPNASDNSAHCYGTTFDITYTRYHRDVETDEFMQPFELTKVLAEVLRDEKAAGRILAKYEKKEHCFHITACQ